MAFTLGSRGGAQGTSSLEGLLCESSMGAEAQGASSLEVSVLVIQGRAAQGTSSFEDMLWEL